MKSLFRKIFMRLLHTVWWASRGLTLGVRAVVLDEAGRVFLISHTYVPGWHFPGGGVEAGETAQEALARELSEEAEIALDPPGPTLHGIFHNTAATRRDHVLVYVVRAFSVRAEKRPDREIAAAGFFPLDALPEGTTSATRARLREILDGEPLSSAW